MKVAEDNQCRMAGSTPPLGDIIDGEASSEGTGNLSIFFLNERRRRKNYFVQFNPL
jgi:hypothetical protein